MPPEDVQKVDHVELCRRCCPQIESMLANSGAVEVAPQRAVNAAGDSTVGGPGPHAAQMAALGGFGIPFLAQALLTLVAQYGPGLAQQALDLAKDELARLAGETTTPPA